MDLEQIRCFMSVAELGSFSAAARRHFVTQPAVSLRIRALEEAVGSVLIDRAGARLTAAGLLFRDRCREALRAVDQGLAEVAELNGLERGRLQIGAIDAAAVYLLPPLLRKFHALHPRVEIVIRVEPSASLVEAVIDGRLDSAVVALPAGRRELQVLQLEVETLVLMAPPGAGRTPRRVLERLPLIAYPRGSVTRSLIDAALADRKLTPRTSMELAHPEAILRMVEAGLGAAVLPERIAGRGSQRLVTLPSFRVRRGLGLVSRKAETPSPAARAFQKLAEERLARPAPRPSRPAAG